MNGHYAYLAYLLLAATPIIGGQALLLGRRGKLGRALRAGWLPVIATTAWLSFADHFAISAGIWGFAAGRTLGVAPFSVPIEETLFFALTSALVALGVALFAGKR